MKGNNYMAMNQEDITQYKSLYLQTSWGYLNMLRKNVAFLLKGTQVENALDSAHLAAHSLKSQSILMGYNQIGKISEEMEKIFNETKENKTMLKESTLRIILSGLKKVQISLAQISENGGEVDMIEEINKLGELIKN